MDRKVFTSAGNIDLLIESDKKWIEFKLSSDNDIDVAKYDFEFKFTRSIMEEVYEYLLGVSNQIWEGFELKEANSLSSDYFEYYDRELDNNGYLTILENKIIIERPSISNNRLYKFNKKKMQSFLYDLYRIIRCDKI